MTFHNNNHYATDEISMFCLFKFIGGVFLGMKEFFDFKMRISMRASIITAPAN